jgi:protein ImuB
VLVAVDQAAAALGLRPGQALADAQAIAPDLLLRPADPDGDARALHALALWARRYTPLVATDPPEGLLLDITGCAHLLGGEPALLRDALERLRRAGLGARRGALSAWRVDGAVQQVAIGTGQPTREPAHLRRLFAERLERLAPGRGFERLALEARATEPLAAGGQAGLGIGGRRGEAAAGAEVLAQLLDRLAQRLRVHRIAPVASHWPERAVAALGPHAAVPPVPAGWAAPGAPVLLRRRPEPLQAMAPLPDAPPALLRWRGVAHRLRWAEGPQRLEPEWWRARPDLRRRDYYRVELASGVRLWVCRTGSPEAARWLLHGHLP